MEITIGSIHTLKPNAEGIKEVPAARSGREKDRRKRKRDRRKNVREGIFVSLSVKEDRRSGRDRRRFDNQCLKTTEIEIVKHENNPGGRSFGLSV